MIHADPKRPLMFPSKDLLCGGRRRRPACGHHALRIHARNREGAILDRCLCRERCVTHLLTGGQESSSGILVVKKIASKITETQHGPWLCIGVFFWGLERIFGIIELGLWSGSGINDWLQHNEDGFAKRFRQAVSPRKTVQPEQGSNTKRREVKWSLKIKSFPTVLAENVGHLSDMGRREVNYILVIEHSYVMLC